MTVAPSSKRSAGFVVLLLMSLSACAGTDQTHRGARDPAVASGHRIARSVCAACHAVETAGASPMARAPAFASLKMRHTASLAGRVEDLTRQGHYAMPPMTLRPDQVRDLMAYIASLEPA